MAGVSKRGVYAGCFGILCARFSQRVSAQEQLNCGHIDGGFFDRNRAIVSVFLRTFFFEICT